MTSMSRKFDLTVIGGGIVGLATARELLRRWPDQRIAVIEKEPGWAAHQSGHNSGVIHSGIYYRPGSLKARLGRNGNRSMVEFCAANGIAHNVSGKIIVATREDELERLEGLYRRAGENGIEAHRLDPGEARELEPHVACLAALHVPSAGVVEYRDVCEVLARQFEEGGGILLPGHRVVAIRRVDGVHRLETRREVFDARMIVNCAGLYSDRVTRMEGAKPPAMIVPFRGDYYELRPESQHLVRTMIYPVPDPDFPFLGVHFTRSIHGEVHAGPNAVLAFEREGYRMRDVSLRDLAESVTFPGLWRFVGRHWGMTMSELKRSVSRRAFLRSLQAMVPEVRSGDLVRGVSGVRAQAMRNDGSLVDDFLIVEREGALHVCNAPSPAATASLEIAKEIADSVRG